MEEHPASETSKQFDPAEKDSKLSSSPEVNHHHLQLPDWQVTVDHLPNMVMIMDTYCNIIAINDNALQFLNFTSEQAIGSNYFTLMYGDADPPEECPVSIYKKTGKEASAEFYLPDKKMWVRVSTRPICNKDSEVIALIHTIRDISALRHSAENMQILRDFSLALGEAPSFIDILRLCLDISLKMSGMDCGGIYIVNNKTGDLRLIVHRGLTPEFIKETSFFSSGTPNTQLVMKGEPAYAAFEQLSSYAPPSFRDEGLRSFATLPIKHRNRIIGCINVGSHIVSNIPDTAHVALESILTHIRGTILRMNAEQEVRSTEERYRLMLENANEAIIITQDRLIKMANPVALTLTDYSNEEIINQPFYKIVHPDDQSIAYESYIRRRTYGETPVTFNIRLVTSRGAIKTVEFNVISTIWEGKYATLNLISDITEVKEAENKLRESKAKYRLIAENIDDVIFTMPATLDRFNFVSPSIERLIGYTPEEMLSKPASEYFPPDSLANIDQLFQKWLKDGASRNEPLRFVLESIRKDGSRVWTETIVRPLLDENSQFHGLTGVTRDITSLRNVVLALEESEAKYRLITESVNDVIFTMPANLEVINFVSPSVERLLGYKQEEIQGKRATEFFPPGSVEKIRQLFPKWMSKGASKNEILRFDMEAFHKDGSPVWTEVVLKPMLGPGGAFEGITGVARDITARRKIGVALEENEKRYRALFESSPISMWENDFSEAKKYMDGLFKKGVRDFAEYFTRHPRDVEQCRKKLRILDINNATLEIMKCPDKKTFIKNIKHIFVEKSFPTLRDTIISLADGNRSFIGKTVHRTFDNQLIDCEMRLIIVPGYEDSWGRVLSALTDISQSNRMEEALRESERKFRNLFENANDAIAYLSISGEIMEVNYAAAEIFGGTSEELKGRHFTDLGFFTAENLPKFVSMFNGILKGNKGPFLVNLTNRKGRHMALESSAALIKSGRKTTGILIVTRDVTERNKLEEERQQTARLESIGTLAGGIAHDFNNLLTGIMGNIGLVKMNEDKKSETYIMLDEAEKASIRAKNLTQQLLTFSRGGQPIKKQISIGKILQESAEFSLRGSNVKPKFSIPDDLWTVDADEGQIVQVITNLVINAQDSMPVGGIIEVGAKNTLVKKSAHLPLSPGKYVEITIKDRGVGIKQEHLKRIFEPYFTTKQKGSGLGLASVYAIVKNHNGHISVESTMGVGSTFSVYLPALEQKASEKPVVKEAVPQRGQGRILVMDDNELIRELAPRMLSMVGYEVDTAADGKETLQKYEDAYRSGKKFDVVIMDLTIPGGMGGKEAIKKLRKIDRNAKVVASSGYATDPIMANYAKYGFSAVVAKPYSAEEMQSVLHDLLRRRK